MRFSVQENLIPGDSTLERMEKAEEYGFEGMEILGKGLPGRIEEIKEGLATSKIKVSTVCLGYSGDLLGPNRESRERAIKSIKDILRICAEIECVGLIVVPTFGGPKISDLYPWHKDITEVEKKILIEECRIIEDYAEDVDAYLILEPLNRYETHLINRLEQAVEVCEAVGGEHVKVMADFFHMNIEEADIAASLREAADHIVHIHLADSNRLVPGRGHINFRDGFSVLKEIGYKYFMAIECMMDGNPNIELPKSLNYLKQQLI